MVDFDLLLRMRTRDLLVTALCDISERRTERFHIQWVLTKVILVEETIRQRGQTDWVCNQHQTGHLDTP